MLFIKLCDRENPLPLRHVLEFYLDLMRIEGVIEGVKYPFVISFQYNVTWINNR